LKASFIVREQDTDYDEKRNNYRLEFRMRYFVDAVKLFDKIKR
jgi:hypothetical protein